MFKYDKAREPNNEQNAMAKRQKKLKILERNSKPLTSQAKRENKEIVHENMNKEVTMNNKLAKSPPETGSSTADRDPRVKAVKVLSRLHFTRDRKQVGFNNIEISRRLSKRKSTYNGSSAGYRLFSNASQNLHSNAKKIKAFNFWIPN